MPHSPACGRAKPLPRASREPARAGQDARGSHWPRLGRAVSCPNSGALAVLTGTIQILICVGATVYFMQLPQRISMLKPRLLVGGTCPRWGNYFAGKCRRRPPGETALFARSCGISCPFSRRIGVSTSAGMPKPTKSGSIITVAPRLPTRSSAISAAASMRTDWTVCPMRQSRRPCLCRASGK